MALFAVDGRVCSASCVFRHGQNRINEIKREERNKKKNEMWQQQQQQQIKTWTECDAFTRIIARAGRGGGNRCLCALGRDQGSVERARIASFVSKVKRNKNT